MLVESPDLRWQVKCDKCGGGAPDGLSRFDAYVNATRVGFVSVNVTTLLMTIVGGRKDYCQPCTKKVRICDL